MAHVRGRAYVIGVGSAVAISVAVSGAIFGSAPLTSLFETSPVAPAARCSFRIGVFGPLTGDSSSFGQAVKSSVELAIAEHNSVPTSCAVSMREFDSQGDPSKAVALARSAVKDTSIVGVVGPTFSGESMMAGPVFNEAGLATITPEATNPSLAEQGWKTFFRIPANDSAQGPAAARYIRKVLAARRVIVVDDASEYGKGLADIVRNQLGPLVVASAQVHEKQTDFSSTVSRIRAARADVIFYGGYYPEAGLLKRQVTAAGLKIKMVSGDGVKDIGFLTIAGSAASQNVFMTCPCLPVTKAGGTFYADYRYATGTSPGTYGAESYDAARIILDGIAAGRTARPDMLKFIASYDQAGVTKHLKFTDTGESANVSVWVYQVKASSIYPDREVK